MKKCVNSSSPAYESVIRCVGSDGSRQSYLFTGTVDDICSEFAALRANGAIHVSAEATKPEQPKLHPDRIKVVRAMETLARCVNDESVFNLWLTLGVADGDIDENTPDEEIEDYCDDDTRFADLMDTFLRLMSRAQKSGGLFCDGVVSEAES